MNVFCNNYTSTEVLTQSVEKLSLDLIFIDNVCQNIKSFSKQNSAKNFLKTGQKLTRTNSVTVRPVEYENGIQKLLMRIEKLDRFS